MLFRSRPLIRASALVTLALAGACNNGQDAAALTARKEDIGRLKQQLADAMAAPAKVQLTDPEIIELVARAKARNATAATAAADPEERLGQGDLDPRAASRIILNGAKGLQVCYEKALRKNSGLQYKQGLPVNLGLTIRASGKVQEVQVNPAVDREMVECMKAAAVRWKFPPFAGQPVTLEQRLKLTPQT